MNIICINVIRCWISVDNYSWMVIYNRTMANYSIVNRNTFYQLQFKFSTV